MNEVRTHNILRPFFSSISELARLSLPALRRILPENEWLKIARNLTGYDGKLAGAKYFIHDCDTKYTEQFSSIMKSAGIKPIRLPPFSADLNSYSESLKRNHQGLENTIPFPDVSAGSSEGEIKCKERLGWLLKYYYRKAA